MLLYSWQYSLVYPTLPRQWVQILLNFSYMQSISFCESDIIVYFHFRISRFLPKKFSFIRDFLYMLKVVFTFWVSNGDGWKSLTSALFRQCFKVFFSSPVKQESISDRLTDLPSVLTDCPPLFMKMMNSRGHLSEPCGTPLMTSEWEATLSTITCYFLLMRISLIYPRQYPPIPQHPFFSLAFCGELSNAFKKSHFNTSIAFPQSYVFVQLLVIVIYQARICTVSYWIVHTFHVTHYLLPNQGLHNFTYYTCKAHMSIVHVYPLFLRFPLYWQISNPVAVFVFQMNLQRGFLMVQWIPPSSLLLLGVIHQDMELYSFNFFIT